MPVNLKIDLKNINFDAILNLSLKVKIGVVAGILVVAWGAYGGLVGFPRYKSISSLKSELDQLTQKRNDKRKDAAYLPILMLEVGKLERELGFSMKVLPNSEEIPSLINAVENNLRKANLDILSFRPDRESKKDFYAEIPISLRFSGGFREIGDFCQTISKYPRIINIMNISIREPKQKDVRVTLTAETKAMTYRFLKPEELPKKEESKGAPKK